MQMPPSIFMVITVLYTSVQKKYLEKLNELEISFNHPQFIY